MSLLLRRERARARRSCIASARSPRSRIASAAVPFACLLAAAGCDDLARRGLVATVGDWSLSEERMAELLVLAQPFPLDSASAVALARHWQGAASLALRAAAGDSLLGSEALTAASWLDRREALLAADREERLGAEATLAPNAVDSVFREGALRLVAHVVRRVGPETSSAERVLQQRTADRILQALVDGGSWNEAVAESEDPGSRAGGLLGLVAKGELPTTLDRAAFRLQPGQISGVVQSRVGFHVVYRPRLEEVGNLFADRLRQRRLAEADAQANEREQAERGMRIAPGAAQVVGRIAAEPSEWLDSERTLAEWDGGALGAGVAARYVVFFPAAARAELADAPEDAQADLVLDLAVRELRLADMRERGGSLDPSADEAQAAAHADEVEYWTGALALDAPDAPSRPALARHMEAVVARRGQLRSLSPLFEAWLSRRAGAQLRERGVMAAVVQARRMLEGAGT